MSTATLNINEASKACGLSPSVLRIWELRYGWPSPKRKANGYRSYSAHQIEDLRRISELVKHGTPISQLIIDGLPRWPTDQVRRKAPQGLAGTKTLPRPRGHLEAKLQAEIIDAVERRQTSVVQELLQRAMWAVRPQDEVLTALAPVLVGIAEMERDERPLPNAEALLGQVRDRSVQLLRRFSARAGTWVVPASSSPADQALAALAALAICQRGGGAQPWLQPGHPADGVITLAGAATDAQAERRIVVLPVAGGEALGDLLVTPASPDASPAPSAN